MSNNAPQTRHGRGVNIKRMQLMLSATPAVMAKVLGGNARNG